MLSLGGVTAGYGETRVLEDLTLSFAEGERLAIIGRNGMGKTTTLATMMGLTRLHSGAVRLRGADISRLPPHRRQASGLGIVPQTRDIFPSLSVEENLLAGQTRGGGTLAEAYALFPRLRERRRNGGALLSGGEQQMLAIARTLMGRPEVLLLDEPLEGLAPVICQMLMDVFERLSAEGRTIVLVEQHAELALRFADRAVILDTGRIVHEGRAADVLADPALLDRHVGVGLDV
ncbi:High-affinity branched-chain amino acid transport ATP-binding protein LivF [Roseisalinus antarcticus]|uniref:High-affinity branched-chain amino acid transport ATP-binding protein LivF n=2 Tax=Roseisalinus antarcticus TaxID=254357 RepID=A0A1Y5TZM7_9RHOB|nr:High-affinity branched-chain amino acid transport ATP-binding protein LivF [Roseisalinus antarcticus]